MEVFNKRTGNWKAYQQDRSVKKVDSAGLKVVMRE
jgi:hypothetical protein